MRFFSLAASALLTLIPAALVAAQAHDTPELGIVTTFPNNPFSSTSFFHNLSSQHAAVY